MYLSEDFIFSPTPSDSLRDGFAGTDVFSHWTRSVESSTLRPLFNDAESMDVVFIPMEVINTTRFVRYRVEYRLRVTRARGAADEYRGVALLDVVLERGEWRLVRWDEIASVDGFESWGYLRGTLRPRVARLGATRLAVNQVSLTPRAACP